MTDDPRRARVAFVEVVGVSPAFEQHRMARRAQWADLIGAELTAAATRGEAVPRDYRLTATVFVAAVNGFPYEWSAGFVEAPWTTSSPNWSASSSAPPEPRLPDRDARYWQLSARWAPTAGYAETPRSSPPLVSRWDARAPCTAQA
ncbi:hypothetical protein [Streptomyces olivaceiscleroticus]|uniref:Uncharacterized protein n=1 Tax=Streptomyces olivaceiscleroticus TaxID=68245 RepID=A0ABP3JMM6_9ACTN